MKKRLFALLALVILAYACETDDPATDDGMTPAQTSFDRTGVLQNWADNIIMPGYEDLITKVAGLENATQEFTNSPDSATLADLKSSWFDTYKTWQRVSMFEIGPAESVNLRLNVNIYPTDASLIEQNITAGTYNLSLSSNRVAKGFPALDYVLNGDTDMAVIERFQNEANARQYLTDIVVNMRELSTQVRDEWQDGYRDTFVSNNGSSATASVDRMVNDYIFYYEKFLRAGKMGIPAGVFTGTPMPENLEGLYKGDISKTLFLEGLQAAQDFFNGKAYNGTAQGESLGSYLDALNTVKDGADLSTIISAQFDAARNAVQSLGNFTQELESNPPIAFLQAYDEVQLAVPLLKVDMVSAMSISIDFADADGD